jgi:uncharacterized protein (DUF1800 family)
MRMIRPATLIVAIGLAVLGAPVAARAPVSGGLAQPGDNAIVHMLNRVGFGPRPGELERVRAMGLDAWMQEQLHPERISDAAVEVRLSRYETLRLSSQEIAQNYFIPAQQARRQRQREATADGEPPREPEAAMRGDPPARASDDMSSDREHIDDLPEPIRRARLVIAELTAQKILRAVYSDRQLEEVLTDFWFNHFNVFAGKGLTRVYLTEYERDAIRPHVLGTFRELLGATAKSPAMLLYLDNARSADPSFAKNLEHRGYLDGLGGERGQMRPRGRGRGGRPGLTPEQVDRLKQRLPTGINENYARELMELHTLGVDGGYTQQDVVNVARALTGWTIGGPRSPEAGRFVFNPRMHDAGEKVVLGHRIKAGGGIEDGEQVLDILASHPSTARFISMQLVRHFVADQPPPALVDRAAATFRQTRGDLRAVMRAILASPEFVAPDAYRAKVKTPFEFVVSALRSTDANVVQPFPLERTLQQLGMPLYFCQPPTGYKDTADTWVNTGALIGRMNFALALAENRYRGVVLGDPLPDHNQSDAETAIGVFLSNDLSSATRATLARATTPAQVVALALGSPEFQRK